MTYTIRPTLVIMGEMIQFVRYSNMVLSYFIARCTMVTLCRMSARHVFLIVHAGVAPTVFIVELRVKIIEAPLNMPRELFIRGYYSSDIYSFHIELWM